MLFWLFIWVEIKNNTVKGVETFENTEYSRIKRNKTGTLTGSVNMILKLELVNTGTLVKNGGCLQQEGFWICKRRKSWLISSNLRNRNKKAENGNSELRQHMNIIHWNMGAKQWVKKKEEIEAVILKFLPDIFVITEANMKMGLQDYEKQIAGYSMILPQSAEEHGLARIIMLVREGVKVQTQNQFMDKLVAAIWIKVTARGRRAMTICGVYREHSFVYPGAPANSDSDANQDHRWHRFINNWKIAAVNNDVIVIGDTNLDYLRWTQPSQKHERMVQEMKDEIETLGFHQMIQGMTRAWSGQEDSLIDQCWMNSPGRLIYSKNVVRSFSDHNLIMVSFRTKNKLENRHEILKRERKNFDKIKYKNDIQSIDWSGFYESENIDYLNSFFEREVLKILDEAAPLKIFQRRRKYRNWVSEDIKTQMRDRDALREIARQTDKTEDWSLYRQARNSCVKNLSKCKNSHYQKLFSKIETEKSTKNLYRMIGELSDKKDGNCPQQFIKNGRLIRKPEMMANMQLDYYIGKVRGLIEKIPIS